MRRITGTVESESVRLKVVRTNELVKPIAWRARKVLGESSDISIAGEVCAVGRLVWYLCLKGVVCSEL